MYKTYFFPPYSHRNKDTNPYISDFKQSIDAYFDIIDKDKILAGSVRLDFLKKSYKVDFFILNWIESIKGDLRNLPLFIITILGLLIIILRRKKILWVLHNIHPHSGECFYSKVIQFLLFKYSSVILTHSKEAESYAKGRSNNEVIFCHHPIKFEDNLFQRTEFSRQIDVFLWGNIFPYKGIVQFLSFLHESNIKVKVLIIGKCCDMQLATSISKFCNEHIQFENRFASIEEVKEFCITAKYVLFPYVGNSISSSGALIDTLAMGGTPVGPNQGAFKDLNHLHLCYVYNNYDELKSLLKSELKIDESIRKQFIECNSWAEFAKRIKVIIYEKSNY